MVQDMSLEKRIEILEAKERLRKERLEAKERLRKERNLIIGFFVSGFICFALGVFYGFLIWGF